MKRKLGKFLLFPILGFLTLTISCNTSDPNPPPVAVYGCMDPQSLNYNPNATVDDKSCYYASTAQLPSNSVIELYTGVRSKYGPDAQTFAKTIQNTSPENVIIVNIHAGSTALPKTGWPDYTCSLGSVLADTAGMSQSLTSYPAGSVNRYHFNDVPLVEAKKMLRGTPFTALYKDGFLLASNYWLAKNSPVNIGVATYWNATLRQLKVMVEYYYTAAETNPNYLNVALLENGLVGKQISLNDTIPNYVQDHVLRTFLTGQWGDLLTTTMSKRIQKTYTYTVPVSINIDNCDVAAYISTVINGKKGYILTGKQVKAKK